MVTVTFTKRIYDLPAFSADLRDVFAHIDDLRFAARRGRISKAFAEKIMLAVTRVNGCRYCAYGQTRAALAMGVPDAELQMIMAGELGGFPERETVALTFAQHYAESYCRPDPAAWQRLADYYGLETARDIQAYLRMITFGNLFGNTFNALLSRLAGKPAEGSSLWSELGVLLGGFVILPVEMLGRFIKRLLGCFYK
jgi:AhpD family alkylhydroperoxidase